MLLIQGGGIQVESDGTVRRQGRVACVWGVSRDDGGREGMQETRYGQRKDAESNKDIDEMGW